MIFAKTRKKLSVTQIHILVWAAFIIYESSITTFLYGKFWTPLDYFHSYFVNMLLFYFNAHVILPGYRKRPLYLTVFYVILELIFSALLKYGFVGIFLLTGLSGVVPFHDRYTGLVQTIWRSVYFVGMSFGYWFALNIMAQKKEIADLEKTQLINQLQNEKLQKKLADSEIAYLKAQINPHFLFNTLNFLYNSAVQSSSENLSVPILLLSDIMRYALTDTPQTGMVNLEDEIDQINTFIDLNQFRFDHNLQVSFNVSGDPRGMMILPLILLTPVENIFKYGDLKNTSYPATIDLKISDKYLHLTSSNRKLKSRKNIPSHGVGLKNLKLRLDAYYMDAHHIHVSENEDDYIFELEITL